MRYCRAVVPELGQPRWWHEGLCLTKQRCWPYRTRFGVIWRKPTGWRLSAAILGLVKSELENLNRLPGPRRSNVKSRTRTMLLELRWLTAIESMNADSTESLSCARQASRRPKYSRSCGGE